MKRFFTIPGFIAWSATILLPLAMIALWMRSYYARDQILRVWTTAWSVPHPTLPGQSAVEEVEGYWGLASGLGSLSLTFSNDSAIYADATHELPHPLRVEWARQTFPPSPPYVGAAKGGWGFRYYSEDAPLGSGWIMTEFPRPLARGFYMKEYAAPYWPLILLASVPLAFKLCRLFAIRRKRQAGVCPDCGYDLRASKERCPECGTPVNTANALPKPDNCR